MNVHGTVPDTKNVPLTRDTPDRGPAGLGAGRAPAQAVSFHREEVSGTEAASTEPQIDDYFV